MIDALRDANLSAFLATLRARPRSVAAPLPDLSAVRQISSDADLPALFEQHAIRAGMNVRRCRRADLADTLLSEFRTGRIPDAILAIDGSTPLAAEASAAFAALRDAGIQLTEPAGDDAWFSAAAGITTVLAAVAETGSLVVSSGQFTPRSASLIPPIHIALVAASQIVPDLTDAMAQLDPSSLPAAVTLITGPSKTADIEGVLVTGVHGPGSVAIILAIDA
jgi:L-lactate utilization protein LutC